MASFGKRKQVQLLWGVIIVTILLIIYILQINLRPRSKRDWNYITQMNQKPSVMRLFSEPTGISVEFFCDRRIEVHNHAILLIRNVTLEPNLAFANAQGGDDPNKLVSENKIPKEEDEEYVLKKGFFSLNCSSHVSLKPPVYSDDAKHLRDFRDSLLFGNTGVAKFYNKHFTIALMRYEYANVYWTVMDIYDVYLTMIYFNESAKNTHIVLVDARARGHLDALWDIFGSVKMLHEIEQPVTFAKMSWRYGREHSPFLTRSASHYPHSSGFRNLTLSSRGISLSNNRSCEHNHLNVLFIWRRDYVAHPRNPSGFVWRKIRNEEELIKETSKNFPTFKVRGVQLDKLNITQQLRTISQADIFIGMHGAAMTYAIFLPHRSSVIELYPEYYQVTNWHMEKVAVLSGHQFLTWHNKDKRLEDVRLKYTTVPVNVVIDYIKKAKDYICKV